MDQPRVNTIFNGDTALSSPSQGFHALDKLMVFLYNHKQIHVVMHETPHPQNADAKEDYIRCETLKSQQR